MQQNLMTSRDSRLAWKLIDARDLLWVFDIEKVFDIGAESKGNSLKRVWTNTRKKMQKL